MADIIAACDEATIAAAIADAVATRSSLEIVGGGSKRKLGRPMQTARELRLNGLDEITLYEPAELVVSARAGTPLETLKRALAEKGQVLPFEPPELGPLIGSDAGQTVGGVVACNLSGPARINRGACRDLVLGIKAVNGRGEIISSGGRVMKNVTGYDLCKLLTGSYGTLAVMTDVTFKVLPASETETTLVIQGQEPVSAVQTLSAGLGSPFDVTGAAFLPAGLGPMLDGLEAERSATLLRLEGFDGSVSYRAGALARELTPFGKSASLPPEVSREIWAAIRDVRPFHSPSEAPVWRISTSPLAGPKLVAGIAAELAVTALFDWGGGLIWLRTDEEAEDAGAGVVRRWVEREGGHATLIRGSHGVRATTAVFHPIGVVQGRLSQKLKQAFDPHCVLNPGRMYPEL